MEIIRQLTVASKLDPRLVSDLEAFFPEWLESLLPFYNQAMDGGDFAFQLANVSGSEPHFTADGYEFYRTKRYYSGGCHTLLSFYAGNRLFRLDWQEVFILRHGYEPSLSDKISLLNYISRLDNKRVPYDALNNNLSGCFRVLTGDPEVSVSLGTSGTYIVLDADVYRKHVEHEEKWRLQF